MLGKYLKKINPKVYRSILYILVFFGTLLICTLSLAGKYEMRSSKDDIGMLALPAKLAGLDWENVVSTTRYYGFVWYIVFTPLLKYCSSPTVIWNIIVYCNIGLISVSSCIALYVAVKYLEFEENIATVIWCIFCITVTWYGSVSLSNESPLLLSIWLLVLAFCKFESAQTKKQKSIWLIVCILFCTYGFLIHTRAEILYAALVITLVLHEIRNRDKKYLLYIVGCIIVALVMFLIAKNVRNIIIGNIWKAESAGDIQNVEVPFNISRIKSIFTKEGIHVFFDTLLCNMYTATVRTSGVFGIAVIGTVIAVVNAFRAGKSEHSEVGTDVMLLSMASTCAVLLGVVLTWGVGIIGTYSNPEEVNEYYKGMTYFRYYGTFLSPALLVCVKNFGKDSKKQKIISLITIVFVAFLYLYESLEIAPLRQFCDWSNSAQVIVIDKNGLIDYAGRKFALIIAITNLLILLNVRDKFNKLFLIFIMAVQIMAVGNFKEVCFPYAKLPKWVEPAYNVLNEMDDEQKVYVPYNLMAYRLQFLAKNKSIIVGYPEEDDDGVIITTTEYDENIPDTFYSVKIKDRQYLWLNKNISYPVINIE